MIDKTLDMLRRVCEYCGSASSEDADTELFEDSVGIIADELCELGVLIRKLKELSK